MRPFILVAAVSLILFSSTGCLKQYCCGYDEFVYLCTKGTDTTLLELAPTLQNVKDSLNAYSSRGFTCHGYDTTWDAQNCAKGRAGLKQAQAEGLDCGLITDPQGECGPNMICE